MKLMKLSKPGCLPCVHLTNHLEQCGVEYEEVNLMVNPEVAMEYSVMGNPVLLLLDDDGKELDRVLGFNLEDTSKVDLLLTKFKGGVR